MGVAYRNQPEFQKLKFALPHRELQFLDGKNPTFASLNNKTITIDDWEFSSINVLCPTFDEKKAKANGHICILVSAALLAAYMYLGVCSWKAGRWRVRLL